MIVWSESGTTRTREREGEIEGAPLASLSCNPLCDTPGWHTNDGEMT